MLESPIQDQCVGAGLRGCDELTSGVLLYLDGDEQAGMVKIEKGVAANMSAPKELKEFAEGMKMLKDVPGAGQYVAALDPILSIITRAADEAEAASPPTESDSPSEERSAKRSSSADSPRKRDVEPTRPASGVIVASAGDLEPCRPLASTGVAVPSKEASCVVVLTSIRTLTDAHVSPGCPHDVIVMAGDPDSPAWFLLAPSDSGLSVHGANYPVHSTQALVVALLRSESERPLHDVACAVTWAGEPRGKD